MFTVSNVSDTSNGCPILPSLFLHNFCTISKQFPNSIPNCLARQTAQAERSPIDLPPSKWPHAEAPPKRQRSASFVLFCAANLGQSGPMCGAFPAPNNERQTSKGASQQLDATSAQSWAQFCRNWSRVGASLTACFCHCMNTR